MVITLLLTYKKMIYLDNASTSFPKPKSMIKNINKFVKKYGINPNRNAYNKDYSVLEIIYETREILAKIVNYPHIENVIFTANATTSTNVILKGFLQSGDHVIISPFEHNAILRCLNSMENITYSTYKMTGNLERNIKKEIKANTKAIITTHASNVSGEIMDLKTCSKVALENKLEFIVDAAQTLGVLDIDMQKLNISATIFTGHKSLLGPQGIGGFIVSNDFNTKIKPLITGGTGSNSLNKKQPEILPDKFEAGTQNTLAIYGLNASLKYLLKVGITNILKHERKLVSLFEEEIKKISDNIQIIKSSVKTSTVGIISLNFKNYDNAIIATMLKEKYDITTRCGLQCAPLAHETLNTLDTGTIRFSFNYFNNEKDIKKTIRVLKNIVGEIYEN